MIQSSSISDFEASQFAMTVLTAINTPHCTLALLFAVITISPNRTTLSTGTKASKGAASAHRRATEDRDDLY
jgi:hypothetical protein